MRTLRKVILYFLAVLVVLMAGLVVSVYIFKDRIIQQFIAEANKNLNTPITIRKIDVSAWQDFPHLAIVCTDVYVEDSHPGKDTLLWAQHLSFSLNTLEVWNGRYEVRGLQVKNSRAFLKINAAGKSNYNIAKKSEGADEAISFQLTNVALQNSKVSYHDQTVSQHHIFSSEQLAASIAINGDQYKIEGQGDLTTHQIGLGDRLFLENKKFQAIAFIDYNDATKQVLILPSSLALDESSFSMEGRYSFKDKNEIDLKSKGTDTNIQTLLSLLPQQLSERFRDYQSEGDIYFGMELKGEISNQNSPMISIEFGCSNAAVFHPGYQSRITKANLEGSFASPSFSDLSKGELFLKNIHGELNGQPFEANFSLADFTNPLVALDFKGNLDAASLLNFYPIPNVDNLRGHLNADFSCSGRTELLKNRATAQQVRAHGTLDLADIAMEVGAKKVSLAGLSGSLQFNNNDLALSDLSGRLGNSDFMLNGFFKNIITFLLFDNQPIGIEADLNSRFIDLDQLFEIGFGDRSSDAYEFTLSPNLHVNFNCNLQSLHYKKFKPHQIKGNLLVKNQMAVSRDIAVNVMGGSLTLNGIIDAENPKAIDVVSSFKLNGIHVDSLFYLFDNFDQDFIQEKHLKGKAVADVSLEMTLDEKLLLLPETLIADVTAVIKNGELNNFEPLQQLNKYLDDEGLSKLRFADLKNDIHIENETVYIPQMEIRSNVTTIQLSGTHTFDQLIDYRVTAPLRNKKKIDPDEAFGAIEEDNKGQSKIFLKITGSTTDYDVSLDKDAVKKKIASDFKKEVKELKDAFKLKGKQKKKELELSDEEFDWEEN